MAFSSGGCLQGGRSPLGLQLSSSGFCVLLEEQRGEAAARKFLSSAERRCGSIARLQGGARSPAQNGVVQRHMYGAQAYYGGSGPGTNLG